MLYAPKVVYLTSICASFECDGPLHDMLLIATGQRMLYIAEKYDGEGAFYRRIYHITSANDAVANGVKSI